MFDRAAATTARTIIAQINPNVPRTHGHTFIPFRSIDYVVDVEHEPDAVIPELHHQELGEVELKIGEILAAMIPDGATLQIGIGSIPDAVLFSLKNHKHLGIHSEMVYSISYRVIAKLSCRFLTVSLICLNLEP